jgi:hypothetical protein
MSIHRLTYNVYERRGQNLHWIAEFRGHSAQDAKTAWIEMYGDNYGKVVIIPVLDSRFHHVMQEA